MNSSPTDIPEKPLARGRTAEVFDLGDGTVVKLLRDGFDRMLIESEAANAESARAAGAPAPKFRGFVEIGGRHGAVFEHVEGELLLDEAVTEPLKLRSWGKKLGDIHADALSHESATLPALREVLADRIDRTDLSTAHRTAAKDRLVTLPDADNVLHGDFHPGNVILRGDDAVLIDWVDATHGARAADIARTLWLLSAATVPVGTPGRSLRTGIQSLFRGAYRTRVMKRSGVSPLELDLWKLPVVAARLSEGIDHEDAALRSAVAKLTA